MYNTVKTFKCKFEKTNKHTDKFYLYNKKNSVEALKSQ